MRITVQARLFLLGLALLVLPVQAREVEGMKYEESIELAGSRLQLNGAVTRYKAVFKVYTAGLYLGMKSSNPAEVLKSPGAKRISLSMLRDIDSDELGRLFIKGIQANTGKQEFGQILTSVMRMSQVFSDYKRLKPGDTITLDWVPGTGTLIYVRGKQASAPFAEPEFFTAMLRIWLGTDPADWMLKDALLGIPAKTAN